MNFSVSAVKDFISVTNKKGFAYFWMLQKFFERYITFVEACRNSICWKRKNKHSRKVWYMYVFFIYV